LYINTVWGGKENGRESKTGVSAAFIEQELLRGLSGRGGERGAKRFSGEAKPWRGGRKWRGKKKWTLNGGSSLRRGKKTQKKKTQTLLIRDGPRETSGETRGD